MSKRTKVHYYTVCFILPRTYLFVTIFLAKIDKLSGAQLKRCKQ
jgi:hypothetical protein